MFVSGKPYPIIHRVVSVTHDFETDEYIYQTKGDHNPYSIVDSSLNETDVHDFQLLGKAIARVPYIGYVKLFAVEVLNLVS